MWKCHLHAFVMWQFDVWKSSSCKRANFAAQHSSPLKQSPERSWYSGAELGLERQPTMTVSSIDGLCCWHTNRSDQYMLRIIGWHAQCQDPGQSTVGFGSKTSKKQTTGRWQKIAPCTGVLCIKGPFPILPPTPAPPVVMNDSL